jgi:hypothetical protein
MFAEINRAEQARGKTGLLSGVVVSGETNLPGPGFFSLAHELGYDVGDRDEFWTEHVGRVYAEYRDGEDGGGEPVSPEGDPAADMVESSEPPAEFLTEPDAADSEPGIGVPDDPVASPAPEVDAIVTPDAGFGEAERADDEAAGDAVAEADVEDSVEDGADPEPVDDDSSAPSA